MELIIFLGILACCLVIVDAENKREVDAAECVPQFTIVEKQGMWYIEPIPNKE